MIRWLPAIVFHMVVYAAESDHRHPAKIALLWDRALLSNPPTNLIFPSHGKRNATNISYISLELSQFSPFQIVIEVCKLVSEGVLAFVSALSCNHLASISSLLNDLEVPLIDVSAGSKCESTNNDYITFYPSRLSNINLALNTVLGNLKWQQIILVTDQQQGSPDVSRLFMTGNIRSQNFRVSDNTRESDVAGILDYIAMNSRFISNHVVVSGGMNTLMEIFKQANIYDKDHDNQGLFTYQVKWLLLPDIEDINNIEHHLGNLDHVAVLVPYAGSMNSTEVFVQEALHRAGDAINSVLQNTPVWKHIDASRRSCTQNANFRSLNISHAFKRHMEFPVNCPSYLSPTCTEYEVYSAFYHAGRSRGLGMVASWSQATYRVYSSIYPNTEYGFNGRHLVVSTLPWELFVEENNNSSNGYQGLCIEILKDMAISLNFTYELTEPEDRAWGHQTDDGQWAGLVGQLSRKEVDMCITALNSNIDRETVIDFSTEFYLDHTVVVLKYPGTEGSSWKLFTNPFHWLVWLCLSLAAPFAGVIIWGMSNSSPFYSSQEKKQGLCILKEAVWYTFGSLLTQGGIFLPQAQSGRFFIGFWWMFCIVVIATYSGNLIAFLTVTKADVPFHTLAEMVLQAEYKFGVIGGTISQTNLQTSKSGVFTEVWQHIEKFAETDPSVLSRRRQDHVDKVLDGRYAAILEKTTSIILMSNYCNIDVMDEELSPVPYAVAVQNNSAYIPLINAELTHLKESGLIRKWKTLWWPRKSFCSRGTIAQAKAVRLEDMQGAYYVMGILIGISIVTLFTEFIIVQTYKRKTTASALEMSNGGTIVSVKDTPNRHKWFHWGS